MDENKKLQIARDLTKSLVWDHLNYDGCEYTVDTKKTAENMMELGYQPPSSFDVLESLKNYLEFKKSKPIEEYQKDHAEYFEGKKDTYNEILLLIGMYERKRDEEK